MDPAIVAPVLPGRTRARNPAGLARRIADATRRRSSRRWRPDSCLKDAAAGCASRAPVRVGRANVRRRRAAAAAIAAVSPRHRRADAGARHRCDGRGLRPGERRVLRPLPWQSPENVGLVWALQPSGERTWLSFPELERLQQQPGGLASVAVRHHGFPPQYEHDGIGRGTPGARRVARVLRDARCASGGGTRLRSDDDRTGAAPVVILSDAFWQTATGRDPASSAGRSG